VPGIVLQTSPAVWPALPWLPAVGVLIGLLPAWLAPLPPLRAVERDRHTQNSNTQNSNTRDSDTRNQPPQDNEDPGQQNSQSIHRHTADSNAKSIRSAP
jgi:hypothetical protein